MRLFGKKSPRGWRESAKWIANALCEMLSVHGDRPDNMLACEVFDRFDNVSSCHPLFTTPIHRALITLITKPIVGGCRSSCATFRERSRW